MAKATKKELEIAKKALKKVKVISATEIEGKITIKLLVSSSPEHITINVGYEQDV